VRLSSSSATFAIPRIALEIYPHLAAVSFWLFADPDLFNLQLHSMCACLHRHSLVECSEKGMEETLAPKIANVLSHTLNHLEGDLQKLSMFIL